MGPHSPKSSQKSIIQSPASSDTASQPRKNSTQQTELPGSVASAATALIHRAGANVLPANVLQVNTHISLSGVYQAYKNHGLQKSRFWIKNNPERPQSPQNVVLAPGKSPGGFNKIVDPKRRLLSSFGVKLLEQDEKSANNRNLVYTEIKNFALINDLNRNVTPNNTLDYIISAFAASPVLQKRVGDSLIRLLADIKEFSFPKNLSYHLVKGSAQILGSYVLGKIYLAIPGLKAMTNPSIERAATSLIASEIYSGWYAKWVHSGDIQFNHRPSPAYSISENLRTLTVESFPDSRLAKEHGARLMQNSFELKDVEELIGLVHENRQKLIRIDASEASANRSSKTAIREKSSRDSSLSNGGNQDIPSTRTYAGFLSGNFDRFPIQYGVAESAGRVSRVNEKVKKLIAKIEDKIKTEFPDLYLQASEEMRDSPVLNKGGIFGAYAIRYNYPTQPHKDSGVISQSALVCLVNDTNLPTVYDFDGIDEAEQIVLKTGDVLFAPHGELVHGNGKSDHESSSNPNNVQSRRMVLVLYSKPLPKILTKHPNVDYDSDYDERTGSLVDFDGLRNISSDDSITSKKNTEVALFGREILLLDLDLKKTIKIFEHFQERQKMADLFNSKDEVINPFVKKINSFLASFPEEYKVSGAEKDFKLASNFIEKINNGELIKGGRRGDIVKLAFQALERLIDVVDSRSSQVMVGSSNQIPGFGFDSSAFSRPGVNKRVLETGEPPADNPQAKWPRQGN